MLYGMVKQQEFQYFPVDKPAIQSITDRYHMWVMNKMVWKISADYQLFHSIYKYVCKVNL